MSKKNERVENNRVLICMDFDRTFTLSNVHSNNYLVGSSNRHMIKTGYSLFKCKFKEKGLVVDGKQGGRSVAQEGYSEDLIISTFKKKYSETISYIRQPEEMKKFIVNHLETGNYLSITSFTLFPEIIYLALQDVGLEEKYIDKIKVISGSATSSTFSGKTEHILKAMELFGVESFEQVLIIDDDMDNIRTAPVLCAKLQVIGEADFFEEAQKIISEMKTGEYHQASNTIELLSLKFSDTDSSTDDESELFGADDSSD